MSDDTGMMSSEDEDRLINGDEPDENECDCGNWKSASEDFCHDCLAEAAHQAKCDRQQRPY